jgi:Cu2+-exporting ATPase
MQPDNVALLHARCIVVRQGFFINAWKQAKHRSANMDTLVALSTGIAYLFSVFNMLFADFWHQGDCTPYIF